MSNPKSLEVASDLILERVRGLRDRKESPIVLIDGRAGSGKSSLAELIESRAFKEFEQAPRLIHMDDLYPGWQGLREGSLYLVDSILAPLQVGRTADWQIWDWMESKRGGQDVGNGWRSFEGGNLLIIEGCGSVSRQSAPLADLLVWVESSSEDRHQRFLDRDRGEFKAYWSLWSQQEDEFYQDENSRQLCDLLIEN